MGELSELVEDGSIPPWLLEERTSTTTKSLGANSGTVSSEGVGAYPGGFVPKGCGKEGLDHTMDSDGDDFEDAAAECEGTAEALVELAKKAERGCDVCNSSMSFK